MTESDHAVIRQCGRYFAHKILTPRGLIKAEYLTPDECTNLAAIHGMYGHNIPNVVLRASTTAALAELVSCRLADESSLTHIEVFFADMLKVDSVTKAG